MGAGAPSPGKGVRIDLVPILDALVVVIFFLVLSISFTELTKVTLPPTQIVEESKSLLQNNIDLKKNTKPRLLGNFTHEKIDLVLEWDDEEIKKITESISRELHDNFLLSRTVEKILYQYKIKYPGEKTLIISTTEDSTFQEFISIVDGAKIYFPDIVMNSYKNAEGYF